MNGRGGAIGILFRDSLSEWDPDMSETDIYKTREPIPQPSGDPQHRKGHRRRSSSRRLFDDHDRQRRSGNSGLRRLLHLSRKSENEKRFWWGTLIVVVALLTGIALWQFWYLPHVAREQEQKNDVYVPVQAPAESATE